MLLQPKILHPYIEFKTARSGGKGGQNVNKVETKVELYFDVRNAVALNDEQKKLIFERLSNRINADGILMMSSQTERSQLANKKKVMERFDELIVKALEKKKKRIPTKISAGQKVKRLGTKKKHSEKKQWRKKDSYYNI